MTPSRYPYITDELLSAYLDEAVTAEEKLLIEAAVADEPALAWRLETLRQTVQLVRMLPAIALPRSFTLNQLPGVAHQPAAALAGASSARRPATAMPQPAGGLAALWQGWRSFWQLGSPLLRNAAAVSLALFLFLVVGDAVGSTPFGQRPESATAPVAAEAPAPAALPATATGEQVAPPPAGPPAETDDLAANLKGSPEAAPAAAAQADRSDVRAGEVAAAGRSASVAAAGQPAPRSDGQEEVAASSAVASGMDQRGEISAMGSAGDVESDAESVTAESLSSALATRRALSDTAATTVTTDESTVGEDEVVAAAAVPSETETVTLAEPAQELAPEDVAADSAHAPDTIHEEGADDVLPASPAVAPQAAEATLPPPGAEASQASDHTVTPPQEVVEVRPAQEQTPVDSLRPWLLNLSQLLTGLVTLVFGALWWRSRSQTGERS